MTQPRSMCCRPSNLRIKCFIIGYLNLIASIVDIACHLVITAIVTRGFQCDVSIDSLHAVNWPWLEPILLFINLGTHGFYPFPLVFRYHENYDYMPIPAQPRCYPAMLHVSIVDVLNFTINVIWLRFVLSYVIAVHRKKPEPMRMFYSLSCVKLILQIMYFAYQPDYHSSFTLEAYWFIKLIDICIAAIFLIIINKYIHHLRTETTTVAQIVDKPPSYNECLINAPQQSQSNDERKTEVVVSVEEKSVPEDVASVKIR